MVFKVVLALVFGVDVQHDQSELHHQVDAFLQSMRKSLGHADSITHGGKAYQRDDIEWEYVKFCFRSSLKAKITGIDHLLGIHATVANYLTTSNREQLPVDHPIRRLIKPFTYCTALRGVFQRAYAYTENGMHQLWDCGRQQFQFHTFPELVARQQINTIKMPFHEDGLDYWSIVHKFVSSYIDLYYKSDTEILADRSIQNFWAFLDTLPGPFPPLNLTNLKNVIAQCIFWVTAIHNHVGTLAEHASDPAFVGSSWVEGEMASRPGDGVRYALLMSITGFKQLSILKDFSHVMLDDKAKQVCRAFTDDLNRLIDVIDARNETREQKFMSFHPSTIEMAVSI
ncbi:hypothetical protein AC1031_009867 [Aphanomyces cochlioides]|nr:hypothetical protein AC1031_009867 [Aphanomyces cochlioides]